MNTLFFGFKIFKILDIDYRKYARSVDGIILNVPNISDIKTEKDVTLVEIKTTKAKNATKLPYGAFLVLHRMKKTYLKQKITLDFALCTQLTKNMS